MKSMECQNGTIRLITTVVVQEALAMMRALLLGSWMLSLTVVTPCVVDLLPHHTPDSKPTHGLHGVSSLLGKQDAFDGERSSGGPSKLRPLHLPKSASAAFVVSATAYQAFDEVPRKTNTTLRWHKGVRNLGNPYMSGSNKQCADC